ncbi:class I SAM-dependent methyltransferase [Pseudalkalibacillus decolorationis]|uniref:class I SAM-dependent methyltransferase n=1 Tax=Pseudalkalibacillus decolorationis TaxID=163879 RepID=UPI0021497831|nr:class I SAM-dependent methyltransferase [Pseudalkalibacillus decolorationis]
MSDHYYTNQPSSKHNRKEFSYTLRGRSFRFYTDAGVFSKDEVDFGSRLLIESIVKPDVEGRILDMGCGYGPIGISLASVYTNNCVTMVDVNERAVELARLNSERNQIRNVEILQSDLFAEVPREPYSLIVSNPPIRAGKSIVHTIFEQASEFLTEGGELWIVIQKKQGAPSAIERLDSIYNEVDVVEKKKGYHIIRAKKH